VISVGFRSTRIWNLCRVRPNSSSEATRFFIFISGFNNHFVRFARSRFSNLPKRSVERNHWRFCQVVGSDFSPIQRTPHGEDQFFAFRLDLEVYIVSTECTLARNRELHLFLSFPGVATLTRGRARFTGLSGSSVSLCQSGLHVKWIVEHSVSRQKHVGWNQGLLSFPDRQLRRHLKPTCRVCD
jgi:hypothetical protein